MTLNDALQTIVNRNNFYRDGYRLMLRISFIQTVAILLLVGGLVVMALSAKVEHVFFATTTDGRIINIVPLNEPFITDGALVAWVAETSKRVLTLSFSDFRQRLQDVAYNFTPQGWETFSKALKDARILELIEERKMVTEMTIEAAPEIIKRGEINGVYAWVLQMPVSLTFKGEQAPQAIKGNLRVQISRVSTLQHPKGVGIDQFLIDSSGIIR
ncbi:MAG: DotI/IcmL/TraM family protein [Alphaproteobacteria bacterium]|nr:DotI/IcmL/TraM family protein [Alphaproteobacteria bacterium]